MKKKRAVSLILLAAGLSRRFGSNKLFYEPNGIPLYRLMTDKLLLAADALSSEADCSVYVVTQYEEILADITSLSRRDFPDSGRLTGVFSPDSPLGISYSIRAGIAAASARLPGNVVSRPLYFFFAADQPWLTTESIIGFIRAALASPHPLGCVCYGDRPGNPAFFDSTFLPELAALTGDCGGKKVLHRHRENCLLYPLSDEKELEDVDKPPSGNRKQTAFHTCAAAPKSVE